MKRKAIIFGIKGEKLTKEEAIFIKKEKPWGIILFSRNIKNINQLRNLTKDIRINVKDNKYPILVDQEGGRVSRLDKIFDFSLFSQNYFGKLYNKDKKRFYYYFDIYVNNVSEILKNAGININTVPVLDVLRNNTHKVISDRSYSNNPNIVSKIGSHCIDLFKKNKIATVMKHIPGHGLGVEDSHYKLPIVTASKSELILKDFKPFKNCNSIFAMTAHVIYKSYDLNFTATHSKIIIDKVIRKYIGFKGLLISDDISMKALKYDLKKNATLALDSGCNLVLHCNGKIKEMKELVKFIPKIDNFTSKKTSLFYNFLK